MKRSSTKRTKDAAIYREAAERAFGPTPADHSVGCCDHINFVASGEACHTTSHCERFCAVFAPSKGTYEYWGDDWGDDRKECRILALCFMAAMIEAGDA